MPSNSERGVSQMELETKMLNLIFQGLQFNHDEGAPFKPVDKVNGVTARLINRGHPAGYVTNDDGTFMVTVEKVSNAVMIGGGESNG